MGKVYNMQLEETVKARRFSKGRNYYVHFNAENQGKW